MKLPWLEASSDAVAASHEAYRGDAGDDADETARFEKETPSAADQGATRRARKRYVVFMRFFLFAIFLVLSASACTPAPPAPLAADFGFRAICPQQLSIERQRLVERKMFDYGFDVLDIGVTARERLPHYPFRVKIVALDKAGRNISLTAMDHTRDIEPSDTATFKLHVGLYSRPPTKRDAALESAMISWVTTDLGCTAEDVYRDDNGSAAMEMYENTTADVRNLFKEAPTLGGKPDTLLMH